MTEKETRIAIHAFTAIELATVLIAGGSVVVLYVGMGSMALVPLVSLVVVTYFVAGIAFIATRRKKAVLRKDKKPVDQ